ncbi:winged helix-turn-helix transcriptional regulator [Haloarcula rubripromontorii]|uniref:Winged helix-turn-helix transcriptional regulator n=1 Tax=Haloarcula rubripromontorii TaxID=1705562 RepID=A0A847U0H9_9EURY|nr:helix-turn-helix domain-containing protein [Haloarcula rubripromontorii]NLV05997.1 winged helix-turn-helix transcriptional regulator [Haloarcula rubripromontorii]
MRNTGDQRSAAEADQPVDGAGYGPASPSEAAGTSLEKSLGVDLCLSHPELILTDTIESSPDVTVRPEQMVDDGTSSLLVIEAAGETLDQFETALERDSTVCDHLVLDWTETSRVYRVEVADSAVRITPSLVRAGGRALDIKGTSGQWLVHAQFRSRAALSQFRAECSDRNITFRLDRLYWTSGEVNAGACGLTADQQVALETAHREGYFDVPRGISQAELADKLGISPSAMSQRIRRGMDQVVGSELGLSDE